MTHLFYVMSPWHIIVVSACLVGFTQCSVFTKSRLGVFVTMIFVDANGVNIHFKTEVVGLCVGCSVCMQYNAGKQFSLQSILDGHAGGEGWETFKNGG